MARIAGLITLVAGVRTYFTSRGYTASVAVGWKPATYRINEGPGGANRVVFIPSNPNGKGGRITIAQKTHTLPGPEPIGTWEQVGVASFWAADASSQAALADEEKQFEAVNTLFEKTVEAVRAVAHAAFVWGDTEWVLDPLEHSFGRELRVGFQLKSALFDRDYAIKTPGPVLTKELG